MVDYSVFMQNCFKNADLARDIRCGPVARFGPDG